MMEKVTISGMQTGLLVFLVVVGGEILFTPNYIVLFARQDSWMASIISVGLGLLFIFLYTSIARHFPNKSFADITESIFGKTFGKVVAFLFYFYFFILITLLIREFSLFLKIQMYIETPLLSLQVLFVFVIVMGVRMGFETFTRAAELSFSIIIILFVVLASFSIPGVELDNFLPMFENGVMPIFEGAFSSQYSTFFQVVVFLLIFPSIKGKGLIRKPFIIGGLGGGAVLIILTTLSIGVLGTDITLLQYYPSYTLAKHIYIGDFITRIEVLITGIWFLTAYFKSTIYFYALSVGMAQTLKLNDYKILTLPLGIIVLIYSLNIYPNRVYFQDVLPYWNSFGLTICLIIPLIMLVIAKVRKL